MSIFLYNLFRVWIGELKMKKKYTIMLYVIALLLSFVIILGGTYAYFAVTLNTAGNDKKLNIVTEDLGSIKWVGTKVYTSDNLLPGEIGLQTFTIEKNSATGKGIYEIDLNGIVDEAFNNDIEITLYKTTDTTKNNVSVTSGNTSMTGTGTLNVAKEDTLNITGTPEKIYGPKTFKTKNPIILEQTDFDNSTLQKTTYYLVYHYKNNGNQNNQQGKSFSGEISVKLILEKGSQQESVNAVEYITTLAQTDTTNLAVDDYGNTRYIGKDPNNYVWFDEQVYQNDVYFGYLDTASTDDYEEYSSLAECINSFYYNVNCKLGIAKGTPILWRIIGVMKDVGDGTGNKSDRVKLIRSESIGDYSWDTSESSINGGYGVNEWSQADLMKLLNPGYESESVGGSLYWNNKSGTCYNGEKNTTTSCNFTSTGIKDKLKNMLGNAVWNTGSQGTASLDSSSGGLTKHFYTYERSTNTGKICTSGTYCNDTVARTTTWTGKVGLMYPSDYGYATSGGSGADRATCLNTNLSNWGFSSVSDCKNNDWLFKSSQLTLSPAAGSSSANGVFRVSDPSYVTIYSAPYSTDVRPVGYLLSNTLVQSGDGSSGNPFILSGN